MNSVILVLVGSLALTVAAKLPEDIIPKTPLNLSKLEDYERIFTEGRSIEGRSLSSRGEKKIKEFLKQMPFGFPELGLPVLAPYVKEEFGYQIKELFADINANFQDIRIEGLDNLLINHFEITYVLNQRLKYSVTFPKIVARGKYKSDSTFDLIKEFGINVRHYGEGNFEVILENLSLRGDFKYTMPFLLGSISIYNFAGSVEMENLLANINGLTGESGLYQLINDKIEEFGVKFVRTNQELINNITKEFLLPLVNKKLHGKKVWSVIG